MGKLDGKVAIISGAARGQGEAEARAFVAEGASVVLGDVLDAEGEAVAASLGAAATYVHLDVTQPADWERAVKTAQSEYGKLDVLVNNAGIQQAQAITDTTLADWERMMAVHLRGAFLTSREAARVMIPRRSGRIIIVSSQLAYLGRPRYTAYSAAKGGLLTFTRALAQELAPHGILVNGIAPGLIDTGFDPLPDEAKRAHAASLPLKRLGAPDDLVGAFVFLASDESRYFCGQTLHPNGGEIMP